MGKVVENIMVIGIVIIGVFFTSIYADTEKKDVIDDLDKNLEAIEKDIKKIEQKVRKREEEEKDIDPLKELTKAEKLMRSVSKDFNEISSGKKGEEIVKILKKVDEKLSEIVSKIKLNVHPPVKKQQDIIDILEYIIRNWAFQFSNCPSCQQKKKQDQQHQIAEKELQKLLRQLKKQRAQEEKRRKKQKGGRPDASSPATSAYDVPPSEPPTAEIKSPTGGDKSGDWGRMTERERESVEETEAEEIPHDVGVLYKEFQKALGKEETK